MVNNRCPICGCWELNDGSEETLYTCECDIEDDQEMEEHENDWHKSI